MSFDMEFEEVIVPVKFKITWGPGMQRGTAFFKFIDCCARLVDGTGNEIGAVEGNIGGSLTVKLPDKREVTAFPRDVWIAVCAALGVDNQLGGV